MHDPKHRADAAFIPWTPREPEPRYSDFAVPLSLACLIGAFAAGYLAAALVGRL